MASHEIFLDCGAFTPQDVIISRTNQRGIIISANEAFQKISDFAWQELHYAPHKILRHGDMPKAVFYLLWETLAKREIFCGFIKNATKSGGHYWVLATVFPIDAEYLSVRILPTKDAVDQIVPLYQRACEREQKGKLTPSQSAAALLEDVKSLGYSSYDDFIARAAANELLAREVQEISAQPTDLHQMYSAITQWDSVQKDCHQILHALELFRHIPINMRLESQRLSKNGQVLSTIAQNFTELGVWISNCLRQFEQSAIDVGSILRDSTHSAFRIRLLRMAIENMKTTRALGDTNDKDIKVLEQLCRDMSSQSKSQLTTVMKRFDTFASYMNQTKRNLSALSVTRVVSAIENAHIKAADDGQTNTISAIIDQLQHFQTLTSNDMRDINNHLIQMRSLMKQAA